MKLFRWRRLTDAELVEKIRKQNQSARWRAWWLLCMSLTYLGMIAVLWIWTEKTNAGGMPDYAGGCFAGLFTGIFLIKSLLYFVYFTQYLFGRRQEKLLVALYDQLHSQGK